MAGAVRRSRPSRCLATFSGRSLRSSATGVVAGVVAGAAAYAGAGAPPALAFDPFFGLFAKDTPPPVSATTLPYSVAVDVRGEAADKDAIAQALRDASATYRLRHDAPSDGDGLMRRLAADSAPLLDALSALGYYDAQLAAEVAGAPVTFDEAGLAAGARRADDSRNRAVVPIKIVVTPGPLYRLRRLDVDYPRELAPDRLPHRAFRLKPGDPARADDIRAAQIRLVDWVRARGHPLAKVGDLKASVDHATHVMDLQLAIVAGPKAGIGAVTISGSGNIPVPVVASHVYARRGQPYSTDVLAETKRSIARIPAVGSVRIREGDSLDADGNVPIFIDVTERPRHVIGVAVRYSTLDGPGVTTYYEDRNLFGGGEKLRLQADVALLPSITGASYTGLRDIKPSDFGGRIGASFLKPGLFGSSNDLLLDTAANRTRVGSEAFGGYTASEEGGTIAVVHRFSDTFSVQAGVQGKNSYSTDVLGQTSAALVGGTTGVRYDSTDSLLDPTRGVRITGDLDAYGKAVGSTVNLVEAHAAASTYYALDEDARYVLAGRIAAGSLTGAPLTAIPAEERFYAGGGSSVRGFTLGTISPLVYNQITGGRSELEGSLEARVKVTQTIGLVPFIDAGGAFRSNLPSFDDYVGVGAGLGLRYLTPIGPIRFDVATPVNRRHGDSPVAVYVSIGQSF
ncbi:Outer membrane protein assembly factor [Beijerinckiaceae bacterium RH AL1]|nr:Outer membrane protein assembly factor [Beijerinckiaceae bacterium RH CH11]VVB48453.1 Outer membrane protein assembly factor [Beijerinckiaceae bacterium RH AL8]VVC56360.1 Outer membrane protein assembly factor [Beijerinckiaceae bacterium RH AL1]